MELRHIRYFLAVAEEASFTRAALRIGIGQPPLSQQIRNLEREIGAALFRRLPHGAELTAAGAAFLPEARSILAQAERATSAARRAAQGETGNLRVGFTGSAAFNPIVPASIRAFRRRYPDVAVSLVESNSMPLLKRLADEEVDAVFIRPAVTPPDWASMIGLCEENMCIVLPTQHPLASADHLPLLALAAEPFVLFPRAVGLSLYDEVMSSCRAAGFEPIRGQEAPQISSVVNLVAAELGVSVVPASIQQLRVNGVAYVDIEGSAPVARLALATRGNERSSVVKNFAAIVIEERQALLK